MLKVAQCMLLVPIILILTMFFGGYHFCSALLVIEGGHKNPINHLTTVDVVYDCLQHTLPALL